jgi:hypothetical protein
MITPEQKAKELIDKMYNTDDPMGNYPMCFDTAKQCALIAVEEILQIDCCDMSEINFNNHIEYWIAVQQVIQKL